MFILAPLPILVAALATVPVGFLWYSPVMFLKPWMQFNGLSAKQMKKEGMKPTPFLVSFLSAIALAAVLSMLITLIGVPDLSNAWKLGTVLWFGFDFMPDLTRALFAKKPLELMLIDTGHQAVNILVIIWVLSLF